MQPIARHWKRSRNGRTTGGGARQTFPMNRAASAVSVMTDTLRIVRTRAGSLSTYKKDVIHGPGLSKRAACRDLCWGRVCGSHFRNQRQTIRHWSSPGCLPSRSFALQCPPVIRRARGGQRLALDGLARAVGGSGQWGAVRRIPVVRESRVARLVLRNELPVMSGSPSFLLTYAALAIAMLTPWITPTPTVGSATMIWRPWFGNRGVRGSQLTKTTTPGFLHRGRGVGPSG